MSALVLMLVDLVAVGVLTFGLYARRHRRRDLVAAYLAVNIGVLAVATALSASTAGVGLGLGLFGVLSIIRLRSLELTQQEIAYYFASLALGLLGGLAVVPVWPSAALMALVVAALWVGDHPRLLADHEQQVVLLDRAVTDPAALTAQLEHLLDARVGPVRVLRLDLVNDSTLVDVRFTRHAVAPDTEPRTLPSVGVAR